MPRFNQFGYDESAPNPPWITRDVLNKCSNCGGTWVGPLKATCSSCTADAVISEIEADRIVNKNNQQFRDIFGFDADLLNPSKAVRP